MYLVFVYLLLPLLVLSGQDQPLVRAPSPRSLAVRHPSSAFGDSRAENIEELALTDIVLTASVDGKFHAFNRTNGQLKWSMRDVPSNPQSYPLLHELVRTDHTSRDIHEDDVESDDIYIIEPQSGEIFVVPPGSSASTPLERLPFTIPQLVEMSPFRFVGDDQRMFLGRKETSIVTLDLDTGSVISIYADQCIWDEANATTTGETRDFTGVLDEPDDFESKAPGGKITSQRREIHIGRTDYHVAVHIRGRGIVQNLSFSVYGPNNVDRERQLAWTRTQDDRYLQPLTDGQIMSFRTSKDPGDPLEWSNKLSHPT
jgi:serine/threonine-protein kinase/endoribonuclease IRE1